MSFQMMDAYRRDVERIGQRIRDAGADQQCAAQARPLGIGDRADLAERHIGFAHDLPHQRDDAPDVIARSELRNDAAIFVVHRDLRIQRVRQQAAPRLVERDAGLVAGRFDSQRD